MSNLKLREVIKQIRQCKTAAEERGVISQESALIRNAFKVSTYRYLKINFRKKIVTIETETSPSSYFSTYLAIPQRLGRLSV